MEVDRIIQCDVTKGISLPDRSVHCVITSPPYWGLRCYGYQAISVFGSMDDFQPPHKNRDRWPVRMKWRAWERGGIFSPNKKTWIGALGLEPTPEFYLEHMVAVFHHVWRVLRDDGALWLNMGDSFYNPGGTSRNRYFDGRKEEFGAGNRPKHDPRNLKQNIYKSKDLCMMPARLAMALQADGWYLRSDIIWAKPNPMPESVTDRPTKSHEHMFLLAKKPKYFYDADAIREDAKDSESYTGRRFRGPKAILEAGARPGSPQTIDKGCPADGKTYAKVNKRDVWTIPTQSFPEAHFATFPEKLVEPCIKAGTSEKGCCPECGGPWVRIVEKSKPPKEVHTKTRQDDGFEVNKGFHKNGEAVGSGQKYQNWLNEHPATTIGWKPTCECNPVCVLPPVPCTVYDPFMGSGTVGLVAYKLNRHYIGTELNPEYIEMAEKRIGAEKEKYGLLEA